jgi:ABC-type oligopeptide transport system substrate-binding subunit
VALPGAPSTLDPILALTPVDRFVVRQLWDPLFRFGPQPEPEPAAASGAEPDAEGRRWTFTLRPGLRWPGGGPIEAQDFARGWQRALSPTVPDELFAAFRPIVGAGVYRAGLVEGAVLGLRAPSPGRLQVELEGPGAHFRHVAALWLGAPAPAGDSPPGPFVPPGNGPFLVQDWTAAGIALVPNPAYVSRAPEGPLHLLTSPGAPAAALTDLSTPGAAPGSRLADVVPVPEALAGAVLRDPRLAPGLLRQVPPATLWLTCNVDREPLDKALVRKALACAVDRAAYVERALRGAGIPAHSLIPPGCPGHDPAAGTPYADQPEVALAFLRAAGVDPERLQEVRLTIPATAAGRTAAEAVLEGIQRRLGVRLGLDEVDRYAYVRLLEQHRFDLAFGGWESPYPDPEGWFWLVFGAGKAENRSGWESPALDSLWRGADGTVDAEARLALYRAAQQTLLEEMPVLFLAHPLRLAAVDPRVAGLSASTMDDLTGAAAIRGARLLADA